MVERVKLMLRRDGALGALRRILRRLLGYVVFSEDHLWFALDTSAGRPKPSLPSGLTLTRAASSDAPLLAQLTTVVPRKAITRIEAGNELWLVLEGDRMLLNLWIFRGHTPAIAAPQGELALPADTVCMEDVEAIPAARGRGIAPGAYAVIADTMLAEGRRWIVCKTGPDNAAARRAMEKAGFQAVALMRFKRIGRRGQTSLEPFDSPYARAFAERVRPGLALADGAS